MDLKIRVQTGAKYAAAFIAALLLGLVGTFVFERDGSRVVRGISVGEHLLSGKTEKEIRSALLPEAERLASFKFKLSLAGSEVEHSAESLGLSLDVDALSRRALGSGRGKGLVNEFGFWLARLVSLHSITAELALDEKRLRERVEPWSEKLIPPPVPPHIIFKKTLEVEFGRAGGVVDFSDMGVRLKETAHQRSSAVIFIEPRNEDPLVGRAEIEARARDAKRFVSSQVILKSREGEAEGRLKTADLGRALFTELTKEAPIRLLLRLDIQSLRRAMRTFLTEIERAPRNANFEFGSGDAVKIIASTEGLLLDEDALVTDLLELKAGQGRTLEVPFRKVAPKFTTEQAEGLKVGRLLSSFTTQHACCQARVKNIHFAAEKLDGTVLMPGERFSLNEHLGPRDRRAGYFEAPTIVHGEMEETWGGGISQLATTLFNAVLHGGLEIVQRQPHSIYFPRYPEGHEATVSFPEPDLIFRNDTEAPLIVKTQFTGTFIKVLLYGDNGGRKVRLNRSKRYDLVDVPVEYEIDEEMDHEQPRRLRAGQSGWTVLVSREVKFPDGRMRKQQREVVYQPRAELVRAHPCIIPEGHEDYTGEACPEPEESEELEEGPEDGSSEDP
jgi:vancomycin resistance protein YoaR